MNALCIRCQRRERAPGLLVCEACLNGLIRSEQSTEPVLRPFVPPWRRRLQAKDMSGWNRAA